MRSTPAATAASAACGPFTSRYLDSAGLQSLHVLPPDLPNDRETSAGRCTIVASSNSGRSGSAQAVRPTPNGRLPPSLATAASRSRTPTSTLLPMPSIPRPPA